MFLGPVFRAELLRTGRQRRYYVLRVIYGLALLLLLWGSFRSAVTTARMRMRLAWTRPVPAVILAEPDDDGEVTLSIAEMAEFAAATFHSFATTQLYVLLALVPPLFAGTIADEKQRKTLHYLMASRLSGGEIVFDKLAARLLHICVFVALGLPVISFLTLFGGVAIESIVGAYALTASSVFFAAALAVWVSTGARRVRRAVLIAYLLEAFWLVGPFLVWVILRLTLPRVAQWLALNGAWVVLTTPVTLEILMSGPWGRTPGLPSNPFGLPLTQAEMVAATVGLQSALGLLLLVVAMVRLRPTFRRQEGSSGRLNWFGPGVRRPRWLARPACGDDAVLWKERFFTRTDIFTKLVVLPATVIASVVLIFGTGIDEAAVSAIRELIGNGYRVTLVGAGRNLFNVALRQATVFYAGLWLLATAGASASTVTVEREQDTWISLIATPLDGRAILRGKMLGAGWGLRGFGTLLGLLWLAGLVTGAVHPLGLLAALGVLGLLTWFVAALGTYASLTSRSTSRALAWTLGVLIFLNGGYLVMVTPFGRPPECLAWTCTPLLVSRALLSYGDLAWGWEILRNPAILTPDDRASLAVGLGVLVAVAVAAWAFSWRMARRFDVVVDRPRRGLDAVG